MVTGAAPNWNPDAVAVGFGVSSAGLLPPKLNAGVVVVDEPPKLKAGAAVVVVVPPKLNAGAGLAASLVVVVVVPPKLKVVVAAFLSASVEGALVPPPNEKAGAGLVSVELPPKLNLGAVSEVSDANAGLESPAVVAAVGFPNAKAGGFCSADLLSADLVSRGLVSEVIGFVPKVIGLELDVPNEIGAFVPSVFPSESLLAPKLNTGLLSAALSSPLEGATPKENPLLSPKPPAGTPKLNVGLSPPSVAVVPNLNEDPDLGLSAAVVAPGLAV